MIVGNYYDKESGISLSISRQDENFKTTIKYKNGTSKEYEMRFWDSISIVGFEEDAGYFVEIRNGKIRLYSADTGDHVQNLGSFEVPSLQKKVKSIINDIDDKLESVLEHINKKIAEQVILSENGEKLHYTISIGASHFSIRDKNLTDTIKRVDDALYLAKRTKNSYYIIG